MSALGHAQRFDELIVYQKACSVVEKIFELTKHFPKEETYSLTDQVRRSSRSIGAQLAEAWGKRRYERHFVSKLTDADAEQLETQHWVRVARHCGYLAAEEEAKLLQELNEIGRMLHSMIAKAHLFCRLGNPMIRESTPEYCGFPVIT